MIAKRKPNTQTDSNYFFPFTEHRMKTIIEAAKVANLSLTTFIEWALQRAIAQVYSEQGNARKGGKMRSSKRTVTKRKLSDKQVREIIKGKVYGKTHTELAAQFGVCHGTIRDVLIRELGDNWTALNRK